jgi:glycosyltransferase involved in cell wall biosynthesis
LKRILVIANNLKQASYRLRVEALIEPLRKRGFKLEVHVRSKRLLERRRLLRSAGEYHAVLLQRKLLDPWDARLLRRRARRILFDVDDAVMFTHRSESWLAQWRTTRRFHATAAITDHIVAGNQNLATMFRERGCGVTVLPTMVDPNHYKVKTHGPSERGRLVWIGSRSTLPYLQECLPAIAAATKVVPTLELLTIGDAALPDAPLPVEHIPWSVDGEADALCRGDIGIAPTPIDRWTLGKCGFKIIQYMAAGLPVIASPVGANVRLVRENETGFLPARFEDWPAAIAALANDVGLRERMGRAGRTNVECEYNLEHAAQVWADLLAP